MKIAYTICSANYLPFAKSLADSFIQHNPDYTFIIALADAPLEAHNEFFLPHQVVSVLNMNLAHFEEMSNRYSIFELSCALKPYVADYLFAKHTDCETLFYFDSDILVFGSLQQAEVLLQQHTLLLTPHLSTAPTDAAATATELSLLRTGLYNAGFFGLSRCNECNQFLTWWKDRLRYYCFNDAINGLFVDQLWLSLAPVYFSKVFIQHNPGYNLAYWNFSERQLIQVEEDFVVNEKHPLTFFHFSGYDINQSDIISKHQPEYVLSDFPMYQPLFEKYQQDSLRNDQNGFSLIEPSIGKKPALPIVEEIVNPPRKNFFKRKLEKLLGKEQSA